MAEAEKKTVQKQKTPKSSRRNFMKTAAVAAGAAGAA
ncbi:MAG TPA: hypothetical protein DDZ83_12405, partial [Nitrospinae bacterium]|nr:hypothetical protein [Nitrospinota bacterium]